MKFLIFVVIFAFVQGFCIPIVTHCPQKKHMSVCSSYNKIIGVYEPGSPIYKIPGVHDCTDIKYVANLETYSDIVVAVKDSSVTFPKIRIQYSICTTSPDIDKFVDFSVCKKRVWKLMESYDENYEDTIIETFVPEFMNNEFSQWNTEDIYNIKFHTIQYIIHNALQSYIINNISMPIQIINVDIPIKPILDSIQSERFAEKAESNKATQSATVSLALAAKKAEIEILKLNQTELHKRELIELIHEKKVALQNEEIAHINKRTKLINAEAEAEANKLTLTEPKLQSIYLANIGKSEKTIQFWGDKHPPFMMPIMNNNDY